MAPATAYTPLPPGIFPSLISPQKYRLCRALVGLPEGSRLLGDLYSSMTGFPSTSHETRPSSSTSLYFFDQLLNPFRFFTSRQPLFPGLVSCYSWLLRCPALAIPVRLSVECTDRCLSCPALACLPGSRRTLSLFFPLLNWIYIICSKPKSKPEPELEIFSLTDKIIHHLLFSAISLPGLVPERCASVKQHTLSTGILIREVCAV